jgi:hypothetical protein
MPADHDTRHDTRPLGRTGIHVLPLGIGTNKWRRADRGAVLETYRTIHDAGPCMIDTAEIYFSERVVGDCLRAGPTRAVIASKFLPFPGRTSPRRLMSALDGSLARRAGPPAPPIRSASLSTRKLWQRGLRRASPSTISSSAQAESKATSGVATER